MPRRANGEGSRRPRGTERPGLSPSSSAALLSSPNRAAAALASSSSSRSPLYGLPGVSVSSSSLNRPDAPLAPHLLSAEAHLGRMTLTAPDNMLRRQAQERERERRARKVARRGLRTEPVAMSGGAEPRPPSAASSRSISPRRRQRQLSNAQQEQAAVVAAEAADPITSSSRLSEAATRPRMSRSSSGPAVLPQEHVVQDPAAAPITATQSVPTQLAPRASLRRHNIYHEIAHLGLPGVESSSDYSDEDGDEAGPSSPSRRQSDSTPPPPFPQGSRRPETPPRAPPPPDVEGGEEQTPWTEEDERRWVDYRRRVPDSPPPAFVSEGEEEEEEGAAAEVVQVDGTRPASPSEASESSAGEEVQQVTDEEQRAWELDAQRGLSFEERLHRLELRRRRKEGMAEQRWREERANEVAVREMLEQEARQEAAQRAEVERAQMEAQDQALSPTQEAAAIDQPLPATEAQLAEPTSSQVDLEEEVSAVVEAVATPELPHAAPVVVPSSSAAPGAAPRAAASSRQPDRSSFTNGALSVPSLQVTRTGGARKSHSRSTSDQRASPIPRGKATAIRPRPSSESHSRFRDDASAAAERRRLAWGVAASPAGLHVPLAPPPRTREEMEAHRVQMERATTSTSEGASSSSMVRPDDNDDSASDASSDSAGAWEAEQKAFEAMRAAAERTTTVADESGSEDEAMAPPQMARSPGQIMRESLPKAPPPLALGRSRGAGLAYDASESDSSADEGEAASESDDSLSPDDGEVQRHVNERWSTQDIASAPSAAADLAAVRRSLDSSLAPAPTASSSKGKQPVRPPADAALFAQQSRHAASDPNLPGSYTAPAGEFEPDSSSSASFSGEEEGGMEPVKRTATLTSMGSQPSLKASGSSGSLWQGRMPGAPQPMRRAEVNDRLKGLFDAPMPGSSTQQQAPTRRSSQKSTRSIDGPEVAVASDRASMRSSKSRQTSGESIPVTSPPAPAPPRKVSVGTGLPDEQQLRREALLDIARIQGGVQGGHNSLAALERLLSGSLRPQQQQPVDPSLPFTNRQSSYAPLPRQSRLPQITDATRHFPPSRAPTISSDGGSSTGAAPGSRARPPVPGSRISALRARFEAGQETGGAQQEGAGAASSPATVDAPASPTRPLASTISRSGAVRRAPPPVPPRQRVASTASTTAPPASSASAAQRLNGGQEVPQRRATPPLPNRISPPTTVRRPPPPPPSMASGVSQMPGASPPQLPPRPAVPLVLAEPRQEARRTSSTESAAVASPPDIIVVPPHTGRRPLPTPPTMPARSNGQGREALASQPPVNAEPSEAITSPAGRSSTLRQGSTDSNSFRLRQDSSAPSSTMPPPQSASNISGPANTEDDDASSPSPSRSPPRRQPSLGITDLDVLASRLDLDGSHFDELAALQEFLGPAEASRGGILTPHEMASLPVGPVYLESRRVTREGKTKSKLACLGLRVERCAVCMSQFKEGQMAVVLQCLHVFHEEPCARTWFRTRSRACPTCRIEAVERVVEAGVGPM